MQYRRFGKTDLRLSTFSLGTMRYLASEGLASEDLTSEGLASEDNAIATVERAIALGINHLETAQGYGNSEIFLGIALRSIIRSVSRQQVYITSKIPPTPDADALERQIDQSLQRLGVDYLDCFALHGLNTTEHLSWVESSQGCMLALRRALADGRIRHLGFSTHAPLEVILRAINTDQFEFVNLHYYWFNQRNAPAVALASAKDMGVFIISPADKGGMLHTPPHTLKHLCQPFLPLELTYRFLLSDRRITTLSVGAAHPGELEGLMVSDQPLTPEESAALQRLQQHKTQALGTDQCSQCQQCLPCPEAINIPEVLRLRNLAIAYDMTTYGQYRYQMFENTGHWFPGRKGNRCTDCGDCLPRCPENLDIPRLLRDTHDRLKGESRRRLWGE